VRGDRGVHCFACMEAGATWHIMSPAIYGCSGEGERENEAMMLARWVGNTLWNSSL
jgi:hypothetical protein